MLLAVTLKGLYQQAQTLSLYIVSVAWLELELTSPDDPGFGWPQKTLNG